MNNLKRGTVGFGILLGALFALLGILLMLLGFWKTLALAVLFGIGYFIGAVNDKSGFVKEAVDKVVPKQKNQETIDFRAELEKEQEAMYARETGPENEKTEKTTTPKYSEALADSQNTEESAMSPALEEDEA